LVLSRHSFGHARGRAYVSSTISPPVASTSASARSNAIGSVTRCKIPKHNTASKRSPELVHVPRGGVDRPGRDAEAIKPQPLDQGTVQVEALDADSADPGKRCPSCERGGRL